MSFETTTIKSAAIERRGLATLQVVLVLSIAAIVLLGIRAMGESSANRTNALAAVLLGNGAEGPFGTGEEGLVWEEPTNGGGGESDSDPSGSGSGSGPGGSDNGSGSGEGSNDLDDGEVDPVSMHDLLVDIAAEQAKLQADAILAAAKEASLDALGDNIGLLDDLGVQLEFGLREGFVKTAGVIYDATTSVDGLMQADREIKRLAESGQYAEAWEKTWSAPAKFITETMLGSKHLEAIINKLPEQVQVAIKVSIPRAAEAGSASLAQETWSSVGKGINDTLWGWYEKGYVPRPRIPRDHDFGD